MNKERFKEIFIQILNKNLAKFNEVDRKLDTIEKYRLEKAIYLKYINEIDELIKVYESENKV